MRERPKSRFDNEDGSINLALVGEVPEYPEVVEWDREYADACDHLAEIEAVKSGKRRWGRWYLTKAGLVTRSSRPKVGTGKAFRGGIYDIDFERLGHNWESHMSEKRWIGEKGHRDLHLALEVLRRERN